MTVRPPKRRRVAALAALVLAAALLAYQTKRATPTVAGVSPGLYKVTKAVDGDTLEVSAAGYRDTVRLIGADTPETHDPRKPLQCYGQIAANRTRQLVEGKSVRLESDPADNDRDKYGRLLRYLYLPDGRLLNASLIHEGYAFAYVIFPFQKKAEFRQLEADARAAGRGLWTACGVDETTDIKQTITR